MNILLQHLIKLFEATKHQPADQKDLYNAVSLSYHTPKLAGWVGTILCDYTHELPLPPPPPPPPLEPYYIMPTPHHKP